MLWIAALCDDNRSISVTSGLSLMLGAFAYISIRERALNAEKNTWLRKSVELGSILFIVIGSALALYYHRYDYHHLLLNGIPPMASVSMYFYLLARDKLTP
jgi:hypothetical protein